MSVFGKDIQSSLLADLADLGSGQAELEPDDRFRLGFLPVAQHLRCFDPDVLLVVGERGTGKSELFQAVFTRNLLKPLEPYAQNIRLPMAEAERIQWIAGHPAGDRFPDARGLKRTLTTPERSQEFWFAYLVRALERELPRDGLLPLFREESAAPEEVLAAFENLGNDPLIALDRLDKGLRDSDRWIFIGYDELDTLGGFDWDLMARAVRGLVSFWASYSRRWMRIRPKLFVRTDILRRHADIGGADLPKLAANKVELSWSSANLLAMLLKRIANKSEGLFGYCSQGRVPFHPDRDINFGAIPKLKKAEDARPFIERATGAYMGANPRKGQNFSWILDHLRDGNRIVTPRSLVRLFGYAAERETNEPRAIWPRLLSPTSLRMALARVSVEHVSQAISNEWPWLFGVRERVRGSLVPWERKDVITLLQLKWDNTWGEAGKQISAPEQGVKELVEYLVQLGVFRERSDGRLDVPDIYLFGLGLLRKGGVRSK